MSELERRFKSEYGGMIVNNRKVGEAIMIGTDIVVMPVRVNGQQIRIGVASKSGVAVAREETFREIFSRRIEQGPESFRKLFRNITQDDTTAYYSLSPSELLRHETVSAPEVVVGNGESTTTIKYANKSEAIAFCKGFELSGCKCKTSIEEIDRNWYAIIQHLDEKPASYIEKQYHTFYDFSFPWE